MRVVLFWSITQRVVTFPYRRFGTISRFHLHGFENVGFLILGFLILEDGKDRLSRNGGKELPLPAADTPEERNSHTVSITTHWLLLFRKIVDYYYYDMTYDIFYVYGSVHHNTFYEITNRCSYMQSILFHC